MTSSSCGRRFGTARHRPTPCPSSRPRPATRSSPPSTPPRRSTACATRSSRHRRGEWVMPAKVYLDSRRRTATSARCPRAAASWRCSSGSPRSRATRRAALPTVIGAAASSATRRPREPLAILDARAVTALRTGAVAAVAAEALARAGRRAVGSIGCGLHGAWAARCLAAAGLRPRRLPRPERRGGRGAGRRARLAAGDARRGAGLRRRLLRDARATRSSSTPATCARACT